MQYVDNKNRNIPCNTKKYCMIWGKEEPNRSKYRMKTCITSIITVYIRVIRLQ